MSNKNQNIQNLLRNDKNTYGVQTCTITLRGREQTKKIIIKFKLYESISNH